MLLFKYFTARNLVFDGASLAACNSLSAGGNVGLLSTFITLGSTVCFLPRASLAHNSFFTSLMSFVAQKMQASESEN